MSGGPVKIMPPALARFPLGQIVYTGNASTRTVSGLRPWLTDPGPSSSCLKIGPPASGRFLDIFQGAVLYAG